MSTSPTEIKKNAEKWLDPFFDATTRKTVKDLLKNNPAKLEDSFYKQLAFGTGGMRGIMGPGDNRINKYTLGKNTQGLANYLKKQFPNETIKLAIAHDCRHNSKEFAKLVADVATANNIHTYLFSDLRPTPELSFAVKHLGCHTGIVLTASHNPPEYNGYKVYWQDGGQLVPPQDEGVIAEINALDYKDVNFNAKEDLLTYIDKEIDEAYINTVVEQVDFQVAQEAKDQLKIVFTSLHGTSITILPEVLKRGGYSQVQIVKEQETPDGDFPTVKSPNPEEPAALKMAIDLANESQADVVMGTDPDSDRIGIAVRNDAGQMVILNGNQAMAIKTHFLLDQLKKKNKLTRKEFVASTIVSTPLIRKIAKHFDVKYMEGLTGFKWIAKMVKDHPELTFVGGGEESFGYMVGDFVRDKDAVSAALLIAEIAATQKAKGSNLLDYLKEIHLELGFYKEHLISLVKKGLEGAKEIQQTIENWRANPFSEIAGEKVIRVEDYALQEATDLLTNKKEKLEIPVSNVLIYYTDQGSKIAVRPSGTEPKIKFYISVNVPADSKSPEKLLNQKIDSIVQFLDVDKA
ncbi:MAG TPA: phospho-sugar mutase [Flavobacteriaceae bacterium]|nr:phospho-sugar mutase [Flavobacteriaceae bacterium]